MDIQKEKAIAIAHEFLQSGVNLPFSTEVGLQLLAISCKSVEDIDVDKLVKLIELDPGLTTNVLQLANSVYFSGLAKIVSLRRAIVQIGLEEAINFIHVVLYRKSLPEFPEIKGFFSDRDYWSHSWACAVSCKCLAHPSIASGLLPGELYIAGLLHGIGKLILAIHHPKEFLQCLENSVDFSMPLPESQLDIFGTTDADIACELLKVWQLPENICTAIKYYQNPGLAKKEAREFAGLLQLGYFIANTSGIGNMKDEFCFDVNQTWICKVSDSPLSDEKTREGFVQTIYKILVKKQNSMEAIGEEKDSPAAQSTEPKNVYEAPQKTEAVMKKSWLSRLGDWFRAQFR